MYWLILLRPYSPSRLRAWSDGITPVISCMMIEALMYGFTPSATTEKLDRPPPDSRSRTPNRALFWRNCGELGLVDARDRHVGQEPEDDQDPQDVQQPAPDVRRPEGVQQRFEHGSLRVVAGVGVVGLGRRRRRRRSSVASATASARRPARRGGGLVGRSATSAAVGGLGDRVGSRLGGLGVGLARRPSAWRPSAAWLGLRGGAAASSASASAAAASLRGLGRRPCGSAARRPAAVRATRAGRLAASPSTPRAGRARPGPRGR